YQNFTKLSDWDTAIAQFQKKFQMLFKKIDELEGPRWHQLQAHIHYPFKSEAKGLLVGTKILAKEYLPQLSLNKFHVFAGREERGYQVNLQLNGYDSHNFNIPKNMKGKVEVQLTEASVQESG